MAAVHHVFRTTLIIVMAVGIVGIGAEELRRKTGKIKVSAASGQRMMKILNPDQDFRKAELAERNQADRLKEESSSGNAQLKADKNSVAENEHLDPTGLRGIINKLVP